MLIETQVASPLRDHDFAVWASACKEQFTFEGDDDNANIEDNNDDSFDGENFCLKHQFSALKIGLLDDRAVTPSRNELRIFNFF